MGTVTMVKSPPISLASLTVLLYRNDDTIQSSCQTWAILRHGFMAGLSAKSNDCMAMTRSRSDRWTDAQHRMAVAEDEAVSTVAKDNRKEIL
jgi:hypothetical protein